MSDGTAYYHYNNERDFLGVYTYEKEGEAGYNCFTWAQNPALYLWSHGYPIIIDENGITMQRSHFVEYIVATCRIQRYDSKNIPAE